VGDFGGWPPQCSQAKKSGGDLLSVNELFDTSPTKAEWWRFRRKELVCCGCAGEELRHLAPLWQPNQHPQHVQGRNHYQQLHLMVFYSAFHITVGSRRTNPISNYCFRLINYQILGPKCAFNFSRHRRGWFLSCIWAILSAQCSTAPCWLMIGSGVLSKLGDYHQFSGLIIGILIIGSIS
jgi:hypothetical protein